MTADSLPVLAVVIAGTAAENAASLCRELTRVLPPTSVVVATPPVPNRVSLLPESPSPDWLTYAGNAADVARMAFEQSEARFLLLLHDDVSVGVQSLSALLSHMESCEICAIAVPSVVRHSGLEEPLSRLPPTVRSELLGQLSLPRPWRERFERRLHGSLGSDVPASTVTVVRREAWDRDGGLDPRFNVGDGIADLALRYHSLGWDAHFVESARFVHLSHASPCPHDAREANMSRALFVRQHWTMNRRIVFLALSLLTVPWNRLCALIFPKRRTAHWLDARDTTLRSWLMVARVVLMGLPTGLANEPLG